MFHLTSIISKKNAVLLSALLALTALGRAATLNPLNYSLTPNGPVFFGYDDNSYVVNGLGNPVGGSGVGNLTGGLGDLANGAFGMSVAGGYWNWSPYVLWDGVSPKITFDFGSSFQFNTVTIQGIVYEAAAVYSVPAAHFRTSDDGVTFGAVQSQTFGPVHGNDVTYAYTVAGNAALHGRYLEIQLETPGRWIAISEIQFQGVAGLGGGNPVPDSASSALLCLGGFAAVGLIAWRRRPVARET